MNHIYALSCACHPEDGVRYVGQTKLGMEARVLGHRTALKHALEHGLRLYPSQAWLRKHGPENLVATVLEEIEHADMLDEAETRWIRTYRREGARLMNVGDGGESVWRGGKRPEHAVRMTGSRNPSFGRDRRALMIHARSLQVASAETRATWSANRRGVGNPRAKLSEDDVREIRSALLAGERGVSIAERFAITSASVSAIRHRKTWAHVE